MSQTDQPSSHIATDDSRGHGPKPKPTTIHVNEKRVHMPDDHATGLQIKQHAISEGLNIQVDFELVEELENGRTKNVGNDDEVKLKETSRFLANDGDENS
ncbi:MAG: hypothetical protein JWQ18_1096 [Conexibacter sp.]|nr:hypothetical protein [Conexibacter sp.]